MLSLKTNTGRSTGNDSNSSKQPSAANQTSTKKKLSKWMAKNIEAIVTVADASESDIVIPVMGSTGVGKSTFINTAVGKNVMSVGHDLQSCTSKIEHFTIAHPDNPTRRIIFVDTPGFDDTYVDDAEILKLIAVWLGRSYYEGMKLSGIIYLHEISQTRMSGTSRKNLTMFNKLCGDDALGNVILATTKWGDIELDVGWHREGQLSETYWKTMLQQGSKVARFMGTKESAWSIVNLILNNPVAEVDHTQIQEELIDLQKLIPESEAGKTLRYTLQEVLKAQRELAEQLQDEDDPHGIEELQEKREETAKKLRSTLHQIKELKVPLGRRIMQFFY